MKLKDLTKEQRTAIEADEIGRKLIETFESPEWAHSIVMEVWARPELKRTINRIDDEIEFLTGTEITEDDGDNYTLMEYDECYSRLSELKQQKELYELMEQLE